MTTQLDPGHDLAGVQRRTVRTLVVSQAVGAVGVTIGVTTASLLARDISGSEAMAGLAQTCQVLGTALAAYALARVMRRRGRRVGLVAGATSSGRPAPCSPWWQASSTRWRSC